MYKRIFKEVIDKIKCDDGNIAEIGDKVKSFKRWSGC